MLSVVMLSVVMLSVVIILNVVEPFMRLLAVVDCW